MFQDEEIYCLFAQQWNNAKAPLGVAVELPNELQGDFKSFWSKICAT
jgi:hypothetical protein